MWVTYSCSRCGGVVLAAGPAFGQAITEQYPSGSSVDEALPERARIFLRQAMDTLHAPSGAVMLAASAVDAMLKAKNLTEGSLYSRIDKAAVERIITPEMALWAHEVRLDANDQRHADEAVALPTTDDAKKSVDFVVALGQFMFTLPNRVQRGLREAKAAPG